MPDSPLSTLLLLIDEFPEPEAGHEDVRFWPPATIEAFVAVGLLVPLEPFRSVSCADCASDYLDLHYETDGLGRPSVRAGCPECGPFDVDPSTLRRWRIDVGVLAGWLSTLLGLSGTPESLVPGRLWRLGRLYETKTWCTVHLGRTLHRSGAEPVIARLPERSICLVPRRLPVGDPGQRVFRVLDEIAAWDGRQLVVERTAFVSVEVPSRSKPQPRRASRLASVERLTRELAAHLKSARDHAFDTLHRTGTPKLLPRPRRFDLAVRCEVSSATVSNCFRESPSLQRLWALAGDLDGLMAHEGDWVSSVSPVGVS